MWWWDGHVGGYDGGQSRKRDVEQWEPLRLGIAYPSESYPYRDYNVFPIIVRTETALQSPMERPLGCGASEKIW